MAYAYRLTQKGKKKVARFLRDCKAYRKEILDGKKDTADGTYLPTEDSILEDLDFWGFPTYDDDIYNNSWGVTDHYDLPLELIKGQDFEAV